MCAQRSSDSITPGHARAIGPRRRIIIRRLTCREPKHRQHRIHVWRLELSAVQPQEHEQCSEAGSLVAIDKRMIAHDANRIRRCQFSDVRIAATHAIERQRDGAFQQTFVAGSPEAPPCSASCSSWIAMISSRDSQTVTSQARAARVSPALHQLAGHRHLLLELRVRRGQPHAIRHVDRVQRVALADAELRKSSFGRITPTKLPIWVIFSAVMAGSGFVIK